MEARVKNDIGIYSGAFLLVLISVSQITQNSLKIIRLPDILKPCSTAFVVELLLRYCNKGPFKYYVTQGGWEGLLIFVTKCNKG